jgi:pyrroline-5-carboxylate reductase
LKQIGFIGVGDLAVYTARGLRKGDYYAPILLSPRNREKVALLQREGIGKLMKDNQDVVDHADLVIIATRPPDCLDALAGLDFRKGQILVSVVAGVDIETLRKVVPAEVEIVRAMPVSSAEVGASPTLVYPAHDEVLELFNLCGVAIPADKEDYFNQGSILACVYSWFFPLFDELIKATRGPKLPAELSAELVLGMAGGAARLALANPGRTPAEIADGIATEGTYSKLGLDLLREQQAFAPWRDACKLLEKRLAESN